MFWKKKKEPMYHIKSYSLFDSILHGGDRNYTAQEGFDRLGNKISSIDKSFSHLERKLNKLMDHLELEWDCDRGPRVIPKKKENE